MKKTKLRRPSAGVILGTLALIVAVAGNSGAFAGTKVIVRKGEIAKGAVTAKALAKGAVHPKGLASGAVTAAALKPGAVTASSIKPGAVTGGALAQDAVTSVVLAPGSVYGGSLGEVAVHSAPLKDEDASADLSTWTASAPVTALCAAGERVLSGGVVFSNAGNRRVGIVQSAPFNNGGSSGWVGQITTDTGGQATAEVQALCLK
jgi:hypothetical protein